MKDKINTIEEFLALSDDELFEILAKDQFQGAAGEDFKKRGKEIFYNFSRRIKTTICSDRKVISLMSGESDNKTLLVAAIIDSISGYLSGISAATVAVLVVKEGLVAYCSSGEA